MTNEFPFAPAPSRQSFLETLGATEALRRLDDGLGAREPFLLVTGEPGTGKSALVSEAIARWGQRVAVAYVGVRMTTTSELLEEVLRRFGAEPAAGANRPALAAHLERVVGEIAGRGQTAIIVVDDAHHLNAELIEELRLIANAAQQARRPLEVLLVGLPRIEATLDQPELSAVRQRISARARLEPLAPGETRRYIRHRIAATGDDRTNLFPRKTCAEIATLTGGVPRNINSLAAEALRLARDSGQPTVEPAHVRQAAAALSGVLPKSDLADPLEPGEEPESLRRAPQPAPPPVATPAAAQAAPATPAVAQAAPTAQAVTQSQTAAVSPAPQPAAASPAPQTAAAPRTPATPAPTSAPDRPAPATPANPAAATAPKPAPAPAAAATPKAPAQPAAPAPSKAAVLQPAPAPAAQPAPAAAQAPARPSPPPAAPEPETQPYSPPLKHDEREWVARFLGDRGPIQISSQVSGGAVTGAAQKGRSRSRVAHDVPDHIAEAVRIDDAALARVEPESTAGGEDPAAEYVDQVMRGRQLSAGALRAATTAVAAVFVLIAIVALGIHASHTTSGHKAAASSAALTPDSSPAGESRAPSHADREASPAPAEKPAGEPAAGAEETPKGPYTLDAGTRTDLQSALDVRQRVQALTGIESWVAPVPDSPDRYRVVIGAYHSYSRARNAANMLMTSHTLHHVTVVSLPSKRTRQ